jgi:hypothetical protein
MGFSFEILCVVLGDLSGSFLKFYHKGHKGYHKGHKVEIESLSLTRKH